MAGGEAGVEIDGHHFRALALGHFLNGGGTGAPGARMISTKAVDVVDGRIGPRRLLGEAGRKGNSGAHSDGASPEVRKKFAFEFDQLDLLGVLNLAARRCDLGQVELDELGAGGVDFDLNDRPEEIALALAAIGVAVVDIEQGHELALAFHGGGEGPRVGFHVGVESNRLAGPHGFDFHGGDPTAAGYEGGCDALDFVGAVGHEDEEASGYGGLHGLAVEDDLELDGSGGGGESRDQNPAKEG